MEFPIMAERLTFIVSSEPKQRVDFETRKPRTTESGAPVMSVSLLAMDGRDSSEIKVRVDGDPGVSQGQPVIVEGLRFNVASRAGGMQWWTAERIEAAGPAPVRGSAASPRPASGKAGA